MFLPIIYLIMQVILLNKLPGMKKGFFSTIDQKQHIYLYAYINHREALELNNKYTALIVCSKINFFFLDVNSTF